MVKKLFLLITSLLSCCSVLIFAVSPTEELTCNHLFYLSKYDELNYFKYNVESDDKIEKFNTILNIILNKSIKLTNYEGNGVLHLYIYNGPKNRFHSHFFKNIVYVSLNDLDEITKMCISATDKLSQIQKLLQSLLDIVIS